MNKVVDKIKRVNESIKRNGLNTEFRRLFQLIKCGKAIPDEYKEWMIMNEPDEKNLKEAREYKSWFNCSFAIVSEDEKIVKSLNRQIYKNWHQISIKEVLEDKSDYIVFLGNNIELADFALYSLVKTIEAKDEIAFYGDNDYIVDGKRVNPQFKPGFGIDTILSRNYIGDLLVVNNVFLKAHPELLDDLSEELIYDLVLRISNNTREIVHIPQILYHSLDKKEPNVEAQKEVITRYLKRNNIEYTSIKDGMYKGDFKVEYKIQGNPKVSIVVPNKDHIEDLEKLMNSIKKSTYENYEVVIVENNSTQKGTFEYYERIQQADSRIRVEKLEINYFNYSRIVNFGVEKSIGEYVLLLNNDIEILTPDWIEQMLMYAQRDDVGICGIKLYFPDKTIQHAGVTIGTRGLAGHRYRDISEAEFSNEDYINIVQDLSAVTAACFLVKKELYDKVLGFDEKLAVAFNDVDFCLKIRKLGLLIVYNPFANGFHYESKSRGEDTENKEKQERFAKEYGLFVTRWQEVISKGDPYYNFNYRLDTDIPKINYNKIVRF